MIKNAVSRANVSATNAGRDLAVTSVYLKLNTVAIASAGGGLDFRVPFIGLEVRYRASVAHEQMHTLEMTLVPDTAAGFEIRDKPVETVLTDAIGTIRDVMAHAAGGDDPFLLSDSVIELSFGVKKDGSISLGLEGELANTVTQSIRLTLGLPQRK